MKRKQNTTGLKIAYLQPTNTKGSRYKITQMNTNKSVTISGNLNIAPIEFFSNVLNGIKEIKTFSLLIDNTQNNYYIFNLDFTGYSFDNILSHFKTK